MTSTSIILVTLFIAVIAHMQPVWRRPLYFGVAVPPGFQDDRTLLRYRAINWAAALASLFLPQASPLLQLAVLGASWFWARQQLWPHRREPESLHQTSLRTQPPVSNRVWLWFLPAVLILAAAAIYLHIHFQELPPRIPVHFGVNGPDRWAEKSPRSVYGILLIGLAIQALFALFLSASIHGSRWSGPQHILKATVQSMLGTIHVIALLFAGIALQPLFPSLHVPMWLIVAPIPVLLLVSLLPFLRAMTEPTDSHDPADSDDHWYWGMFYCNPNDPALMVPKRFGLGLTLNFAQPQARYGFPAVMILFFLVIFYVAR